MRLRLTKRLFSLHSWLGLLGGAFLLVIGMAGSILVFTDNIDALLNPVRIIEGVQTARLSIDSVVRSVRRHYRDATITGVRISDQHGAAVIVTMNRNGELWYVQVDPVTGNILDARNADRSFVRRLLALHRSFFFRPWGEALVGCFAVILFSSALSGLIVYRKSLLRVFRVRIKWRGGTRRVASDLHRLVGVTAVLFQLMMSITGFYMISPVYKKLVQANDRKAAPFTIDIASLSLDTLLARSRVVLPAFEPTGISLPKEHGQPIRIIGQLPEDNPLYGKSSNSVSFDPATGSVREVIAITDASWSVKLDKLARGLHFGQYGSLPVKIIYSLGGLTPGLLSITGFILWRKKRIKKKPSVVRPRWTVSARLSATHTSSVDS